MNHKVKEKVGKFVNLIKKGFYALVTALFESYGWRGFIFRVLVVIVLFLVNPLSQAVKGGPAGGKIWLATWGLLIYAIGKLIYDYTKENKARRL